jgi:hypothetical protein
MAEVEIVAPTGRETKTVKALRVLVEGRVGVEVVRRGEVRAWVRCHRGHVHHPTWTPDRGWTCDCEHSAPTTDCYHAEAVMRVVVLPDDVERPPWPETPG